MTRNQELILVIIDYLKKSIRIYNNLMISPNIQTPVIPFDKLYKVLDFAARADEMANEDKSFLYEQLKASNFYEQPVLNPNSTRKTPYFLGYVYPHGWYWMISIVMTICPKHQITIFDVKNFLNSFLNYLKNEVPATIANKEVIVLDDFEVNYLFGGREYYKQLIIDKIDKISYSCLGSLNTFKPLIAYGKRYDDLQGYKKYDYESIIAVDKEKDPGTYDKLIKLIENRKPNKAIDFLSKYHTLGKHKVFCNKFIIEYVKYIKGNYILIQDEDYEVFELFYILR